MNKKYLKLLAEGWEVDSSAIAALGLKNADKLQAKAYLRAAILSRIAELEMTQTEAARRIGVPQPKMSFLKADAMPRGFSSDKLMEFATKLGLDIKIQVRPARSRLGKVIVSDGTNRLKSRRSKASRVAKTR